MTSKKEPEKEPKLKRRYVKSPEHSAAEKAQAVLAVWTERVKPAEVMRAMSVPYLMLQQWQDRAMEGMLQALEPRTNLASGSALSPRLKALLQKRQMAGGEEKLKSRLSKLQEIASEAPPLSNA
jgi:transposase-like protein